MNKNHLELYSDYLISSFSATTATGFSELMNQEVSHDQITRFLSKEDYTSRDLWLLVKPQVRQIETEDAAVIFDDTLVEKPHTDENDIICWHWDHSKGRIIKGANILNCLYRSQDVNIPVAFEIIKKEIPFSDLKTKKVKRRSSKTKNEQLREMLDVCRGNQLCYKYVLTDSWFACTDTMKKIKIELEKEFIMALKENRTAALSVEDKKKGRYVRIDSLTLEPDTIRIVYFKGIDFPVALIKQVFTNKDQSQGVLYLACSETTLDYAQITTLYQKRWNVEVFHKSIKNNTGIAKSPTRTVRTQSNHFFLSIYAFFKLEILMLKHHLNHFALKTRLYVQALKVSFRELEKLRQEIPA